MYGWFPPTEAAAYPLTKLGEPHRGHGAPCWSHDGERVYFLFSGTLSSEIWSVRKDGQEATPLLTDWGERLR